MRISARKYWRNCEGFRFRVLCDKLKSREIRRMLILFRAIDPKPETAGS
jgi:hypothetical protein